jgi:DNA mismatch repair protein MSH2
MLRDISDKLIETREGLNQLYKDAADDLGLEIDDAGTKGKGKKAKLNFENHQVFGHCFRLTRKASSEIRFLHSLRKS